MLEEEEKTMSVARLTARMAGRTERQTRFRLPDIAGVGEAAL